MFRIECTCDDKKLHLVLTALTGLIHENPRVVPVVNAVAVEGELQATSDGSIIGMFAQHLKATKVKEFRAGFVRDFLRAVGKSEKSYTHAIENAVAAGLIRRRGKGKGPGTPSVYVVTDRVLKVPS